MTEVIQCTAPWNRRPENPRKVWLLIKKKSPWRTAEGPGGLSKVMPLYLERKTVKNPADRLQTRNSSQLPLQAFSGGQMPYYHCASRTEGFVSSFSLFCQNNTIWMCHLADFMISKKGGLPDKAFPGFWAGVEDSVLGWANWASVLLILLKIWQEDCSESKEDARQKRGKGISS